MAYFANYNANNGTRFAKDIEDTNLRRLIKDIRDIAEGARFQGNECTWYVVDADGTEVARGGMDNQGHRYRVL